MKLVLNIQKKHLAFFMVFVLIIIATVTIAANWGAFGSPPSHDALWTKAIYGKDVDSIPVYDDLVISSGKGISLGGVRMTNWPTPTSGGAGIDCIALPGNIASPSGYSSIKKRVVNLNPDKDYGKCLIGKCSYGITKCSSITLGSWISAFTTKCDDGCKQLYTGDFEPGMCPVQCDGSGNCYKSLFKDVVMQDDWILYCTA